MGNSIDPNSNLPNPFAFNLGDVTVNDPDDPGTHGPHGSHGAHRTTTTDPANDIPPDQIVTTPLPGQLPLTPGTSSSPGDGNAPIRADALTGVSGSSSNTTQALLADSSSAYNSTNNALNVAVLQALQQSHSNTDDINDAMKNIDQQVANLKQEEAKLMIEEQKIQELMPQFMAMLGDDKKPCHDDTQDKQNFAQFLQQQLQAAGVNIDPSKLNELVDGIAKGGQGGMMIAMFLITSIAQADADQAVNPNKATQGTVPTDPDSTDDPNDDPTDPTNANNPSDPNNPNNPSNPSNPTFNAGTSNGSNNDSSDPNDPPAVPPAAAAAGFDPTTFTARLNQIADAAETYAQAPDPSVFDFAYTSPNGDTAAQNALIQAIFPGLAPGSTTVGNSDFANAQQNGLQFGDLTIDPNTLNTAAMLNSLPFGQGSAAVTQYLTTALDQQIQTQLTAIDQQIGQLETEKKSIIHQAQLTDQQDTQTQEQHSHHHRLQQQQQVALQSTQDLLDDQQDTLNQTSNAFTDVLVGGLNNISAAVASSTGTPPAGPPR